MGDHRAEVHITFEIHGKKYVGNWDWINYSGFDDGVDYRIKDWFLECWKDAIRRFEANLQRHREEAEAPLREAREREELARLKAKYESPCPP